MYVAQVLSKDAKAIQTSRVDLSALRGRAVDTDLFTKELHGPDRVLSPARYAVLEATVASTPWANKDDSSARKVAGLVAKLLEKPRFGTGLMVVAFDLWPQVEAVVKDVDAFARELSERYVFALRAFDGVLLRPETWYRFVCIHEATILHVDCHLSALALRDLARPARILVGDKLVPLHHPLQDVPIAPGSAKEVVVVGGDGAKHIVGWAYCFRGLEDVSEPYMSAAASKSMKLTGLYVHRTLRVPDTLLMNHITKRCGGAPPKRPPAVDDACVPARRAGSKSSDTERMIPRSGTASAR